MCVRYLTSATAGAYERWCGVDDAMMTWLGVPEVMEALHIQQDKKGTEKNNLNYQGGRPATQTSAEVMTR